MLEYGRPKYLPDNDNKDEGGWISKTQKEICHLHLGQVACGGDSRKFCDESNSARSNNKL